MHRLLQGDVGAGKTVVAVTALLVAVQGGHQGALDGADRSARGAALRSASARCSTGLEVPDEATLFAAIDRCASSCSRTAPPRPSAVA